VSSGPVRNCLNGTADFSDRLESRSAAIDVFCKWRDIRVGVPPLRGCYIGELVPVADADRLISGQPFGLQEAHRCQRHLRSDCYARVFRSSAVPMQLDAFTPESF
jgi:hypothetical protein